VLTVGEGERLAHRDRDPGPERLMVALKMNHQVVVVCAVGGLLAGCAVREGGEEGEGEVERETVR
jgi:hypothetical protein